MPSMPSRRSVPWTHGGRQCPVNVQETIHSHVICRHRTHRLPIGWCSTVVVSGSSLMNAMDAMMQLGTSISYEVQ